TAISATTAPQLATTARLPPRRTTNTRQKTAKPRVTATSEVLEVEAKIMAKATRARPNQSRRRSGRRTPAAANSKSAKAISPPKMFFSSQRPRQDPGKVLLIRPMEGTNRPTSSEPTVRMPKTTAKVSASAGQRQRAPMATPQRVVRTTATARREVWSGDTDQKVDAAAIQRMAIRKGWRISPASEAPGFRPTRKRPTRQ